MECAEIRQGLSLTVIGMGCDWAETGISGAGAGMEFGLRLN